MVCTKCAALYVPVKGVTICSLCQLSEAKKAVFASAIRRECKPRSKSSCFHAAIHRSTLIAVSHSDFYILIHAPRLPQISTAKPEVPEPSETPATEVSSTTCRCCFNPSPPAILVARPCRAEVPPSHRVESMPHPAEWPRPMVVWPVRQQGGGSPDCRTRVWLWSVGRRDQAQDVEEKRVLEEEGKRQEEGKCQEEEEEVARDITLHSNHWTEASGRRHRPRSVRVRSGQVANIDCSKRTTPRRLVPQASVDAQSDARHRARALAFRIHRAAVCP